jgi:ribonuclease HI
MALNKQQIIKNLKSLQREFQNDMSAQDACDYLIELCGQLEDISVATNDGDFPLPEEIVEGSFALFSDGASRGNPGPGAWGALGQSSDGTVLFESSSVDTLTTNNKMELEGAIVAIEWLLENASEINFDCNTSKVFLYSDSKYVVDGTNSWMPGWKRRGWKKADKKAPENLDLWQRMDSAVTQLKYLKLIWVKGHAGHPQNEHCDQLANIALDESGF